MTSFRDPYAVPLPEPAPVINTTPLIDLMLVLLVMFIVSVPIATHKVPLDLPPHSKVPAPPPAVHRIDIDSAGRLFWDGRAVRAAELPARLTRLAADPSRPELHIAADGEARYQVVDETLGAVARAGVTRMGFVGNERFAADLDRRDP